MLARRLVPLVLVLALGVLFTVPVSPAHAGDDQAKAREIELRIKVLVSEAEALKKKGRHDAADLLMERANAWRRELAQERRARKPFSMEQAERVLHGLEMGLEALKALERHQEFEAVMKIANGLRERMKMARRAQGQEREQEAAQAKKRAKGPANEREIAMRRLEIMRVAFKALMEGEKRDAAELMEHAIHALELGLKGRRDEEAQKIRRTAPKVGAQAELLGLASRLYAKWGHEREAKIVGGLAEELAQIARRRGRQKEGGERERDVLKRRLEVMRHALPAFREADRGDLVEHMEKAVHAYEVALSGRRDEEAKQIWKRAPDKENLAELCGYASHLWAEWGHETKAQALKKLSHELLGRTEKDGERHEKAREGEGARRLEHLRRQIHELMEQTERLRKHLEAMSRETRGAR